MLGGNTFYYLFQFKLHIAPCSLLRFFGLGRRNYYDICLNTYYSKMNKHATVNLT